MSWDRDLWIDTFYNVSSFASEGLALDTRWNTSLWVAWEGWWLDPKGKDFGPNAKYFQHDLPEAKKLMAAAGYPNGFEIRSYYPISGTGSAIARLAQVSDGMAGDIGIRTRVEGIDYATEYIPLYRDGQGQYEGWAYHGGANTLHPILGLSALWWSKGGVTFKGFSASGKNDKSGDPQLDSMIEKARQEADIDRQRAQVHEIQRYLAKSMWGLQQSGSATGFTMAWPALRNYGVTLGSPGGGVSVWAYYKWWLDQTKPPFTKA